MSAPVTTFVVVIGGFAIRAAGGVRLVIIFDTNVLSELMKASPAPALVAWLDRQPADSIWVTSITVFEVRHGLALLAAGKRRKALESAFAHRVNGDDGDPEEPTATSYARDTASVRWVSGWLRNPSPPWARRQSLWAH